MVRTGVTAILPHAGNLYADKVLGACHVINGYGKAAGLTQLEEMGTIEAPILLTSTVSVGPAWEGGLRHVLDENPDAGRRSTVNVVVGECFDGYLSDARGLHVRAEHALEAIAAARPDEVAEGSVGAGTGTTCLGFKAGVGNASRIVEGPPACTLGCLVVANYGRRGDLHLLAGGDPGPGSGGAPAEEDQRGEGGSVMVVIATDAPLSERQLRRLAGRAAFGLGRAGSYSPNTSGDYAIAFSTAHRVAHDAAGDRDRFAFLRDDGRTMRDLFEAASDVTCEAVLNSLCMADSMDGRDGHRVEALSYELLDGFGR